MYERARSRGAAALVAAIVATVGLLGLPGGGAAAVPGCGAFAAQGDAQDAFLEAGGDPGHNVAGMDGDGDGVACEMLAGPFKGYATIAYHRKRQFFYGVVTMPVPPGGGEAPCLQGDRVSPEDARALNIFKVRSDGDKPLLGRSKGAEAKPEQGKLIWKVERPNLVPARYYVEFQERIKLSPYGRNQCPGFSSEPTFLPAPKLRR